MGTAILKKVTLLSALLIMNSISLSQTTIWVEDFSGYSNSTTGNNNNTANPANDWTTSCAFCNLANEFNADNGYFNISNTDEVATWTSETIDITGYTNVTITINTDADDGQLDATDCITFYYDLGSGSQNFTTNTTICDDNNGVTTSSVAGLSGTSLIIYFDAITTNTNEDINVLDITVTGDLTAAYEVCDFSFSKTITVGAGSVQGGADLTDYPLLISTTDTDLRDGIENANGYDIAFYDPASCDFIPHQLEYYDNSTGEIVVWVKIPTLYSGAETAIEMYYGNANISIDYSSTDTWVNDYIGVWHFGNSVNDGSSNGNDLTDNSTSNFANAKIGEGRQLDNPTNVTSTGGGEFLQVPNGILSGMTDFTFEGWVFMDRDDTNWERIFDFGQSTTVNFFFTPSIGTGSPGATRVRITTGGNGAEQGLGVTNPVANTGDWIYWTVTYNSTTNTMTVWKDGVFFDDGTGVTNEPQDMEGSTSNYFGRSIYTADHLLDGKFDEFRISNAVKSDGWIETTYSNHDDPANFYTIGDQNFACDTLYSIQSGDWNTVGNWSLYSAGCSCECVPKSGDSTDVFIEGNDVITFTGNEEISAIVIGTTTTTGAGPGELQWTGNNIMDVYGEGVFVSANGTIDNNSNATASLEFDNNSGGTFTFDNEGSATLGVLGVGDATLDISGSADIFVESTLSITSNDAVLNNNNTGTVTFDGGCEFSNRIAVINNYGTIDINDGFSNVQATEVTYFNRAGSVTYYSGSNGSTDNDMQVDADFDSNTFHYDFAGTQKIITTDAYWHLVVSQSGTKNINDNTLDINGDLYISNSATLNSSGQDVNIAGDWINTSSGGFNEGGQTVTFDGAATQTITCSTIGTESFNDLVVNNGGNIVQLLDNIEILNTLDLSSNGYIELNTNDLTITAWNDGDILGYGNTAFIIVDQTGFIKTTDVNFLETVVFPMGLSIGTTNLAIAEIFNLDVFNTSFDANLCDYVNDLGNCAGGTEVVIDAIDYTFFIESASVLANITLIWNSGKELTSFDRSACSVLHYESGLWNQLSAYTASTDVSGTYGANYYSRTGTTFGFSPFTVGDSFDPLPVELSIFDVTVENDNSVLEWVTVTEENNSHFMIQRSADGNSNWETIGVVDGHGTTNQPISYQFIDQTPLDFDNYYRLIQVDYDGKESTHPVEWVYFSDDHHFNVTVYPNPTEKFLNIKFISSSGIKNVSYELSDVKGVVMLQTPSHQIEHNEILTLDVSDFAIGTYILKISTEEKLFIHKILKTK